MAIKKRFGSDTNITLPGLNKTQKPALDYFEIFTTIAVGLAAVGILLFFFFLFSMCASDDDEKIRFKKIAQLGNDDAVCIIKQLRVGDDGGVEETGKAQLVRINFTPEKSEFDCFKDECPTYIKLRGVEVEDLGLQFEHSYHFLPNGEQVKNQTFLEDFFQSGCVVDSNKKNKYCLLPALSHGSVYNKRESLACLTRNEEHCFYEVSGLLAWFGADNMKTYQIMPGSKYEAKRWTNYAVNSRNKYFAIYGYEKTDAISYWMGPYAEIKYPGFANGKPIFVARRLLDQHEKISSKEEQSACYFVWDGKELPINFANLKKRRGWVESAKNASYRELVDEFEIQICGESLKLALVERTFFSQKKSGKSIKKVDLLFKHQGKLFEIPSE